MKIKSIRPTPGQLRILKLMARGVKIVRDRPIRGPGLAYYTSHDHENVSRLAVQNILHSGWIETQEDGSLIITAAGRQAIEKGYTTPKESTLRAKAATA